MHSSQYPIPLLVDPVGIDTAKMTMRLKAVLSISKMLLIWLTCSCCFMYMYTWLTLYTCTLL